MPAGGFLSAFSVARGRCPRSGAELADKVLRVVVSAPLGNALHAVRREEEELTGKLWSFTPLAGDRAGETFSAAVPSCWESYPAFGNYRGEGRYSTRFTGGGNLRFVFRGVSHTARVFLDGAEITRHYNAYTPFEAVVRGAAEGEHTLEIVADNRFSEESALHVPNDYMSYGGVTRAVSVERIGSAYVRSVHVTPECVGGKWRAHVRVCVVNLEERAPMSVEVGAAGEKLAFGARTMPAGESVLEGTLLPADVRTWSPASPALYTVTVRLFRDGTPVDDLVDRSGFREVRVEGKRILLNGAPLRVKGVCRHEDHPHYGCALPFAAMAHDLALIRDLGANSVRTAHHEQQGRVRRIPPPKTLRRSREKNIPRNIKTRARGIQPRARLCVSDFCVT